MSPRKREDNEKIRDSRKAQIMDAALTVYLRRGYHGTDMDSVASESGIAKGLLYYYFRTTPELFRALFSETAGRISREAETFVESTKGLPPVGRLVKFAEHCLGAAKKDPRTVRFSMRLPFDASAVFSDRPWPEGGSKSRAFTLLLERIIRDGIADGSILPVDPSLAANSVWAVMVANLFAFSAMIGNSGEGKQEDRDSEGSRGIEEALRFCFRGLGVADGEWLRYRAETGKGEPI